MINVVAIAVHEAFNNNFSCNSVTCSTHLLGWLKHRYANRNEILAQLPEDKEMRSIERKTTRRTTTLIPSWAMAYVLLDLDPIYQILKVKVFGSRGEGKEETVAFYGFSKVLGGRKQAIASICAMTYNESEGAEKRAVMVIHCVHSSYPANSNRNMMMNW